MSQFRTATFAKLSLLPSLASTVCPRLTSTGIVTMVAWDPSALTTRHTVGAVPSTAAETLKVRESKLPTEPRGTWLEPRTR